MGSFSLRLSAANAGTPTPRRYAFVAYDQLTDTIGPLAAHGPTELGVVVVECPRKARLRPYHKQKLALVLANLRQFALEQAARGRRVVHRVAAGDGDYASALRPFAAAHGALVAMTPAERELRVDLAPLVDEGLLELVPHDGFLTSPADLAAAAQVGAEGVRWRMDAFYRAVRRRTGALMDAAGKPEGGRFSFDGDNRQRWPGAPLAPTPPSFQPDDVTREVVALVERTFADHPGDVDVAALPATRDDAEVLWAWAKTACLPHFGPFEDAMSERSRGLFHSRISTLLNLHRLTPRRVLDDVLALPLPLSSKEGFVRQVLGWREFVKQVHDATDGLRRRPDGAPLTTTTLVDERAATPLPAAYWPASWGGAPSGLRCLDHTVEGVWAEAYSHHITRLMVLANIATLLDVSPRALTDWFWVAYQDAFDWVVEPNVLGMGTFAIGDVMTTKPYVAGAAYVDGMSDHCGRCAFRPKKPVAEGGCPLTPLYWAFLDRHERALSENERMKLPLAALRKRTDAQRAADRATFARVRDALSAGQPVAPAEALPLLTQSAAKAATKRRGPSTRRGTSSK